MFKKTKSNVIPEFDFTEALINEPVLSFYCSITQVLNFKKLAIFILNQLSKNPLVNFFSKITY
jgi:hypothetical protein